MELLELFKNQCNKLGNILLTYVFVRSCMQLLGKNIPSYLPEHILSFIITFIVLGICFDHYYDYNAIKHSNNS